MPGKPKVILEGKGLTKDFKGLRANNEIDFTLHEGEILGLIGPNGAGKTTLVSMISGSTSITRGDVLFKGRSIKGLKPFRIGRLGIARTFQIVKPFPHMTVLENIAVGAMFGRRERVTVPGRHWKRLGRSPHLSVSKRFGTIRQTS